MLKDITLGQFFPADSMIHRLDPRTKLLFTFVYIVMLFFITNIWGYAAAFCFLLIVIALCRIPPVFIFKGLKTILFFVFLTVILNMFMTPGTPIWSWKFLTITREGLKNSCFMAMRLIFLILGTNIMTLTTSPIDLTDGMEHGLRHLPLIRHYAHEISMMMSIALRFIPTLIEETDKIMKAQKARGADFESGGLVSKAKALLPVLVPLFISAFRRADELATAMEARCYRGGENRTRMKTLNYSVTDFAAYFVMIGFIVLIIGTRFIEYKIAIF